MAKAKVDPRGSRAGDDLLAAVKTLKAAGVTPIFFSRQRVAAHAGKQFTAHADEALLARKPAGGDGFRRAVASPFCIGDQHLPVRQ